LADIIVAGNTSGAITISAPSAAGSGVLTLPTGTDTMVGKATTDTLTNKTLVAPALGTPASGVLTNCTGVVAAALPAGSVLQVVSATTTTPTTTTSASFVSTALTASITPRSASNKVLIQVTGPGDSAAIGQQIYGTIYRNATNVGGADGMTNTYGQSSRVISSLAMTLLDSPATTSATSYTVYIKSSAGTGVIFPQGSCTASIILTEIAG